MASRPRLTISRLYELLSYEPSTGDFRWRVSRNQMPIGSIAGHIHYSKYRQIKIDDVMYAAHRLAWFYTYKKWPSLHLDHRNNIRSDNRISNLREANRSQQGGNTRLHKDSSSGFKGVSWHKRDRKWRAYVTTNYKQISLGYFDNRMDARAAYEVAAKKHFGQFARTK